MSIITTYPNIGGIESDDLMIISDVSKVDNPTRTVSIGQLAGAIGSGGVATTVEALSPLVVETDGSTSTVSIPEASGTQNGYMSSTLYNTLGDKQSALNVTFNGTSGSATFDGTNLNIPNYATGGGGSTVVANPGAPTTTLHSLSVDGVVYGPLTPYSANEVAFWVGRSQIDNGIEMYTLTDGADLSGTTFSIAEQGTDVGVFIITASSSYWDTTNWNLTMNINVPVHTTEPGGKEVMKKAIIHRTSSTTLQIEFFMETSSSTELLERVDLVQADTSALTQGIDISVKRWQKQF